MGIRHLNDILANYQNEYPIFVTINRNQFCNHRIAIDMGILVFELGYRIMKTIHDDAFDIATASYDMNYILRLLCKDVLVYATNYLQSNIIPVFVADGEAPVAKEETRIKRTAKLQQYINEREELLEGIKTNKICIMDVEQDLRVLAKKCIHFGRQAQYYVLDFLRSAGLPFVLATGEAEKLCCRLCIDGIARAVVSTDTDCIVYLYGYNVPIITKVNRWNQYECTDPYQVCNAIKYSPDEFTQFCILLGCDYNTGISINKACEVMNAGGYYNFIRSAPLPESLNMERSTELFSDQTLEELCVDLNNSRFDVNLENADTTVFEGMDREYMAYCQAVRNIN